MSRPGRVGVLALPSVPATAATGAGIAVRITFHDPALAWAIAGLAGLLTLLGIFVVSAEAQETIRVWIRHRAEHRLAAAEAFEIRRRIRAATCGKRWTARSAAKIRQDAAACERPSISLEEIMRITRPDRTAVGRPEMNALDHDGLPVANGDGVARGRLGVVPLPDPSDEPE
jgi:hypothetical protein